MATTLPTSADLRHRVRTDASSEGGPKTGEPSDSRLIVTPARLRARMAKAELPTRAFWPELGACLDYARREVGFNLDQLADALKRDPRQVRRWIAGEEQIQPAAIFAVPSLQKPFVVALARLAACEIETTVRIKVGA